MHHLLRIDVSELDPDITSARLWSLGVIGVHETPSHLLAAFTDSDTALNAAISLGVEPVINTVDDHEGLDTWREFATCVTAGPFLICPPWLDPPIGDMTILIDPGYAFGNGSHPSTRLAIEALSQAAKPGTAVLDLGCGSGILSVVGAKLGASVTAVDTDPDAIAATRSNLELNGCTGLVRVIESNVSEMAGTFDVVVINVTIDVHDRLAEAVAGRVADHGTLIAAGMLAGEQEQRLRMNFPSLALIERTTEAEWAAVTMQRGGQHQ